MAELREIVSGLQFPEGPIAMDDGSVVLVEIKRGTLSRVDVEKGTIDVVAECGGGPNGAAIGPDGAAYICNNGGCFEFMEVMGLTFPGPPPATYPGHGSIQRVDLGSGEVTTLYEECDGHPLRAPNDIVFDSAGGFWFTDHGVRHGRTSDRTGIYYAQPDGSSITEVIFPVDAPNGIGLSPAGDRLYVAETPSGRAWAWNVLAPGVVEGSNPFGPSGGELLVGLPGFAKYDGSIVRGLAYYTGFVFEISDIEGEHRALAARLSSTDDDLGRLNIFVDRRVAKVVDQMCHHTAFDLREILQLIESSCSECGSDGRLAAGR